MNFKRGTYVVLLSSHDGQNCWRNDIPEGFCYKLREDSDNITFYIERDINGSPRNGWSIDKKFEIESKFEIRLATTLEEEYYDKFDKPFDVSLVSFEKEEVVEEEHDSLIKLLKNKI